MKQTNKDPDKFARESFSMRGMQRWQVWSVSLVTIAIVIALVVYTTST